MIKSIKINDSISASMQGAIEVDLEMEDGSKRWCFFVLADGVKNYGDFINGTKVRVQYGAKHMIVVSDISEEIIKTFINEKANNGELLDCTEPY
ncbi:MAG: hypothetical protein JXR20_12870 [Balneola sp.]